MTTCRPRFNFGLDSVDLWSLKKKSGLPSVFIFLQQSETFFYFFFLDGSKQNKGRLKARDAAGESAIYHGDWLSVASLQLDFILSVWGGLHCPALICQFGWKFCKSFDKANFVEGSKNRTQVDDKGVFLAPYGAENRTIRTIRGELEGRRESQVRCFKNGISSFWLSWVSSSLRNRFFVIILRIPTFRDLISLCVDVSTAFFFRFSSLSHTCHPSKVDARGSNVSLESYQASDPLWWSFFLLLLPSGWIDYL